MIMKFPYHGLVLSNLDLLIHSIQDSLISGFNTKENTSAAALLHQVKGFIVSMGAPEKRKPVELEIIGDHHP